MVLSDGSNMSSMFSGDTSAAGRRERLMKKRDSFEAFTGKVGGAYNTQSAYSNDGTKETANTRDSYPVPQSSAYPVPQSSAYPVPQSSARGGGERGSEGRGSEVTGKISGAGWQPSSYQQQDEESVAPSPFSGRNTRHASSSLFQIRTKPGRHVFEADVVCAEKLVDMQVSAKRRAVTWTCVDRNNNEEFASVEIPRGVDLSKLELISPEADFEYGKCKISAPMDKQGIF